MDLIPINGKQMGRKKSKKKNKKQTKDTNSYVTNKDNGNHNIIHSANIVLYLDNTTVNFCGRGGYFPGSIYQEGGIFCGAIFLGGVLREEVFTGGVFLGEGNSKGYFLRGE